MECPLCGKRQGRRGCPALGRPICPGCCGSKRLVEVACPADCPFLAAARAHPPAAARRQQERDFALLGGLMTGLSQREQEFCWAALDAVRRFGADPLVRLADADLGEAAGALAATLETAARGVIYEHRARSLVAQRLAAHLTAFLEQLQGQGMRTVEADAKVVFGRMAREFARPAEGAAEAPRARLAAAGRFLDAMETAARAEAGGAAVSAPGPALIAHP